jgi:methanogenic corrinoid protein MtbC1
MLNSAIRSPAPTLPVQPLEPVAEHGCTGSLRGLIESQIIPRLLEAHPRTGAANAQNFKLAYQPLEGEIAAFAQLCIAREPEDVLAFIEKLLLDSIDCSSIFLNLIAPAARHLGQMWDEEGADFTQVTLGLLRMHQITHRLGYEYQGGPQKAGPSKRIMLACAPGSQHILGLAMVSEFFRKDGWQVVVEVSSTPHELCNAVKNEWFDLIGLSVSLTEQFDRLPVLIATLKEKSRNNNIPVLLGGPAFFSDQVDATSLGANGICADALEGVQLASLLVAA